VALRCLGTGANREHLEITDSAALTLPSGGWTMSCMFYPDSGVTPNTFGYMYNHGDPNISVDSASILADSGGARLLLSDLFGIEVDIISSNAYNVDQWNHVVVVSESGGFNFRVHLNGTATTGTAVFAMGIINPTVAARIGDASFGAGREFGGRIAHVSKWDRAFSTTDANTLSSILLSPEFLQQDHIWHIPIWNSSFNFDILNTVTTTPSSALYGNHAPAVYPSMAAVIVDEVVIAPSGRRVQYVRA